MSRAAVWSFNAHQPHSSDARPVNERSDSYKVDFALWSENRVRAYTTALAMKIEPPLAVLSIRRINMQVPVFDGTDDLILNRGAGRILGTASPGESGNIGIAGHRDGFFRGLKDLQMGDRIDLGTQGREFLYTVDAMEIVQPTDVSVLRARPQPSLTLVTCYPFYFVGDAPQRYVVHASIVNSNSIKTGLSVEIKND